MRTLLSTSIVRSSVLGAIVCVVTTSSAAHATCWASLAAAPTVVTLGNYTNLSADGIDSNPSATFQGCTLSVPSSGFYHVTGSNPWQAQSKATGTFTFSTTCSWYEPSGGGGVCKASDSVNVTVIPVPPLPTVSLSASPDQLTVGESSTLTWSSTDATSCTASGGWSGSKATSGSLSVKPNSTVTYTLTCANSTGSAAASAKVTVASVATVSITANPAAIPQGSSSTIAWSTTHAVSCTATGAWTGSQPLSGSIQVSPASTSTYGLSCNNAVGKPTSNSVIVTVDPPPSITSFSATPSEIGVGQSSTLAWSTTNATSCTASGSWSGAKATSGAQSVSPSTSANYTLNCTGPGGSAQQSVSVTVVPAPTLTFTATPGLVTPGVSSTLAWSTTDATTCTASGSWSGAKATSGSQLVTPGSASTYTLLCSGLGGSISKSVTVLVEPTLTLSANPTQIGAGGSSTLTWSSTNTTACTASGAWTGSKATSGTAGVSPASTSSYTLTCSGSGGSIQKSVTVTVVPPPAVTLTANPTAVVQGQQSTLTWTVSGASACTASGGWSGSKSASGGSANVTPNATTSYTLGCSGTGGTTTKSVQISVDTGVEEDWSPPVRLGEGVYGLGSIQDVVAIDDYLILFVVNGVAYQAAHGPLGTWNADWSEPIALDPAPNDKPLSGIAASADLQKLILVSAPTPDIPGQLDLWSTGWTGTAWSTPQAITSLNSDQAGDTNPYLLPDASKLYFASKRSGFFGGWDLFSSNATAGTWSTPTNLDASVNNSGHQTGPYVTPNGSRLYFSYKSQGSESNWDIRYANWTGSSWAASIALPGPINTSAFETEPALSPSGSRIYFLSDRASPGTYSIYMSVRTSADTDGDGIRDYDPSQANGVGDNCWTTPNADQVDANANGIGDVCEAASGCNTVQGTGASVETVPLMLIALALSRRLATRRERRL